MSAYAFFIQTCREEQKRQFPNDNVIFKEFSARCAERWKTLPEEVKQHFSDMATQDRARYAKELQSYDGPKIRNRRRRTRKDPRAPKRALSAFFWYCMDERPKIREREPSAPVGVVAKELGAMWAQVTPEVKARYEALAQADKGRYNEEMVAYREGTFQRVVPGTEDLPPPQPSGTLPMQQRFNYAPQQQPPVRYGPVGDDMPGQQYLGHTIGCTVGDGAQARESSSGASGSAGSSAQQQQHQQQHEEPAEERRQLPNPLQMAQYGAMKVEQQINIAAGGQGMPSYSAPISSGSPQCSASGERVEAYYSEKMFEDQNNEVSTENESKYNLLPDS